MKSWGTRILFLYLGFVALIATLVTLSMRQKTDLVAADYYAQEIAYQGKLDKMNRAAGPDGEIRWQVNEGKLHLQFAETVQLPVTGTINFFCPSDARNDRKMPFEAAGNDAHLNLPALPAGWYKLQLDWQAGEQTYYQEGEFRLP